MIRKNYPMYSVIPSADVPGPGVVRANHGANPVYAPGKRETAPLEFTSNARILHPKLNKESWATSYAQARSEPKTARKYASAKGNRRVKKTNRGRA